MKRLMFGMAVAAAGLAFGVESANVVGYSTADLRAGFTMTGPCFLDVGSDAVDITSITVGGDAYEAGASGDTVYINILADDGSGLGNYSWMDYEGDFEPGWYDVDEGLEPIAEGDVVLEPGAGVWVQGDDGFDLQIPAL